MRSVKVQRRHGRAGGKSARRSARPVAVTRGQPAFGKRKRPPGAWVRAWRNLRACFSVRHPVMWISVCVLFVAAAGVLLAGGYVSRAGDASRRALGGVSADAGFSISSIHFSGNHRTAPDEILSALGFRPGDSIFGADVRAARVRLLALEWVADADVRRQYPDTISIAIVEKLPFALWETANGAYVVERSGRTIGLFDPHVFPHLPVLLGAGAPQSAADIVEAVAAHRAVKARVSAFARVSDRRWNLLLNDDVLVELPEEGWERELDVLEHLIVDKGVLERDISEIDLRVPDNFFFVLRNGQKQQMRGNAA
jgi:cell division protein FtsQ